MFDVSANRHHGTDRADQLRIARFIPVTEALGPNTRAVVMVQGCELRCKGCIVPSTHPRDGGEVVEVEEIARRILDGPRIEGLTFTGGEPMLQSAALARLIDLVRGDWPNISTMSYTGYRIEFLLRQGSEPQLELLNRLDLLIDGPYVEHLHRPIKWRGSSNQRVLLLTDRHSEDLGDDSSVPLEVTVNDDLGVSFVGVPPVPGFVTRLGTLRDQPG